MRSVQKTCKTFSTEFFDWSFSTGSASRNSQSKKVESKKPFFDCVREPDLGLSGKRPFSTDKSDFIRNGLRPFFNTSRIPQVENGPFRLDYFSTGFFWSFFLSSVESIL